MRGNLSYIIQVNKKFCELKGRDIGIAEKSKGDKIWYALDVQAI